MTRVTRDGEPVLPDVRVTLTSRQASLLLGLIRGHVTGPARGPADDLHDLADTLEAAGVQPWDASDPTQTPVIYYPLPGLPGLTEGVNPCDASSSSSP